MSEIPVITVDDLASYEPLPSSSDWLHCWMQATHGHPDSPRVQDGYHFSGALNMAPHAPQPPTQTLSAFLLTRGSCRFPYWLQCPSTFTQSATRNMNSASNHAEVVTQYLASEVSEGRVAGPFSPHMAHISRFGVIPKSHQPNKWRLIIDLSHPKGKSINDGIRKELTTPFKKLSL